MDIIELGTRIDTKPLEQARAKLKDVGTAAKDAEKSVKGLGDKFDDFRGVGGPISDAADRIGGLADSARNAVGVLGPVGAGITLLGTAAVGAIAGMVKLTLSVAEQAGAMEDLSYQTNLSTERLSVIDAVAKMAGSGVTDLVSSADKLGAKLAKQDEEGGKAAKALEQLGISAKNANGEQKDMLKLQEEIVLAVDKAGGSAKAQGLAVQLLGNDYYKLRQPIREVAEKQVDMYTFMRDVGAVTTTKLAKDSGDLGDKVDTLGTAFKGMAQSIASSVLPILIDVVDKINEIARTAARLIRKYTGNQTRTESATESLTRAQQNYDAAVKGAAAATNPDSIFYQKAQDTLKRRTDELNEARKALMRASEADDAEMINAVWGTSGSGNRPAGGSGGGKPKKEDDPTQTDRYRQTMAEAKGIQDARNREYEGINAWSRDVGNEAADAARKQTQEYERQASAILDLLDPMRELNRQIAAINANPVLTEEQKIDGVAAASERYVAAMEKMGESQKQLNDQGKLVFGSLENMIVGLAQGGELSFKSMVNSIVEQMIRMMVQAQIIKPLMNMASGTSWGAMFGLADGGVAINGRIQKFANGGVFNAPTMFRHSGGLGVLGEKGAEAVMPLKRGANGQLGVQMHGGSSAITVNAPINVQFEGDAGDEKSRATFLKQMSQVVEAQIQNGIAKAMRSGNQLNPVRRAA